MNEFTYRWNLKDLEHVKKNDLKVFSCFAGGGGSTMGFKMSGCAVIGCNEIDPQMMAVYRQNHNPKHSFLEPIQTFKERNELPSELFDLDILDGSPPCSSFSMAGNRESDWGAKKKFREGQKEQVLDDLFFHFIKLADKLKPKVVMAENVKGMLAGNAKGYVKQILQGFKSAGYTVQLFLLNAASMGIPQRRERVFFIARRNELNWPELTLKFNEKTIPAKEVFMESGTTSRYLTDLSRGHWAKCQPGKPFSSITKDGSWFGAVKVDPNAPASTIIAAGYRSGCGLFHPFIPRKLYNEEHILLSSFPMDYNFTGIKQPIYQMGMSVPPLMIHKIANEIIKQWFKHE
jgi:DNA (cytosine-5)-methyltransferase 1